ncbi:unnamed protein product [Adineta ricciae]|uniref:Uncharacterized protein n=1 Tax=Adineta ricciae TaxID=249248 RepID=A0A815LYP6_ADIRI|nr:unnamed protein product [Adineta ricciae]
MTRKYIKKSTTKQYDNNDLQQVIEAVRNGSSIRDAANNYHVPYTTLNSHVNYFVLYDEPGRPTKFSELEEKYLEEAALALQVKFFLITNIYDILLPKNWGRPLMIDEFLEMAKEYAASLNKSHLFSSGTPSYDWFRSFLHRHKNLILKKSRPLEKKRASVTMVQVDAWFDILSRVIRENDLLNRPGQIFNCDETGLSDRISYSKVLVRRRTSNAYRTQGGTDGKSYTSVMFCASATGFLLPPFVIYKSKRLFQEWCTGGPTDTGYSNSDNGWINHQLFYEWFDQIFLKHTKDLPRPLVLIADGLSSHFKVETLRLAVQHEVIILCLPSNATHILQPLDLVFFNTLKLNWKTVLRKEYDRTQNKNINKNRFPALLSELWTTNAITGKINIVKSFITSGVFPLNRHAIDNSRILQSNASVNTLSSSIGTNGNNTTATPLFNSVQPVILPPVPADTSNSDQYDSSSFGTSQNAIATLSQILDITALQSNSRGRDTVDMNVHANYVDGEEDEAGDEGDDGEEDDAGDKDVRDEDDDEDDAEDNDSDESYVPHSSSSSKARAKRRRSSSRTTRTDSSDEDFHMDVSYQDSIVSSNNTAQKSVRNTTKTSKEKRQSLSATSKRKRKRVSFDIMGFNSCEEDADVPSDKSPDPHTAIQNTLKIRLIHYHKQCLFSESSFNLSLTYSSSSSISQCFHALYAQEFFLGVPV